MHSTDNLEDLPQIRSNPRGGDLSARIARLKEQAQSRINDILIDVAMLPRDVVLDASTREHPCPRCGGTTRFRKFADGSGGAYCSHCFFERNGDFLATIQWALQVTLLEAVELCEHYLGIANQPNSDIVAAVCEAKGIPSRDALVDYGARPAKRGNETVARVDVYNEHGERHSHFDLSVEGKGWAKAGKGNGGVFLPNRLPKPGEQWLITEGVKDAATLHSLGYPTLGAWQSKFADRYHELLSGCDVVFVPDVDRDGTGLNDHRDAAEKISKVARSVRIAHLPIDKGDTRDALRLMGEEAIRDAVENAEAVKEASETPTSSCYKFLTSEELDSADLDVEYLIDGLLSARQPCIVAGGKKCLKTSTLIEMSISLATGTPLFGEFTVERQVRAALMSGESGLPTIRETARRIAATRSIPLREITNLVWSTELPKFADRRHHDAMRAFLDTTRVEVVIIDPAYLCMPAADAGNLMAQGEILRSMNEVCGEFGVTMLLAHHTKKNLPFGQQRFEPPELEDISWAGFSEWARQWILLGRRERYSPGTGMHRLWLSVGGSMGHSGLWALDVDEGPYIPGYDRTWSVGLRDAQTARDDAKQSIESAKAASEERQRERTLARHCDQVLNSLRRFPTGETKTRLRDAAGLRGSYFDSAVAALLHDGRIQPCLVAKGKREFEGYRLPETANSNDPDTPGHIGPDTDSVRVP